MARSSRARASEVREQKRRNIDGVIIVLVCMPVPAKRADCISRAAITRRRIEALLSAAAVADISSRETGVTYTCRSIRSNNGPEMRPIYRRTAEGVHVHSFVGWLQKPHGHGFIDATSVKFDG